MAIARFVRATKNDNHLPIGQVGEKVSFEPCIHKALFMVLAQSAKLPLVAQSSHSVMGFRSLGLPRT